MGGPRKSLWFDTLLDHNIKWIQEAAEDSEEDVEYQELPVTVRRGFPKETRKVKDAVKSYLGVWEELSEYNGLNGMVLHYDPKRSEEGNLEDATRVSPGHREDVERARETVYWPAMAGDENTIASCSLSAE